MWFLVLSKMRQEPWWRQLCGGDFPYRKRFLFHGGYCGSFVGGGQCPVLSSKTALMILLTGFFPDFWSWYRFCLLYVCCVIFQQEVGKQGNKCIGSESYLSINVNFSNKISTIIKQWWIHLKFSRERHWVDLFHYSIIFSFSRKNY